MEKKVIEAVVTALEKHKSSVLVQAAGCWAMYELSGGRFLMGEVPLYTYMEYAAPQPQSRILVD